MLKELERHNRRREISSGEDIRGGFGDRLVRAARGKLKVKGTLIFLDPPSLTKGGSQTLEFRETWSR